MLGHAQGLHIEGWEGVLPRWVRWCLQEGVQEGRHLEFDAWYWVDLAVVDYAEGNW